MRRRSPRKSTVDDIAHPSVPESAPNA